MAFDDPTVDFTLEGGAGGPGLEPSYPAAGKEQEKTGREVVTELREIRRALESPKGPSARSAAAGPDISRFTPLPEEHEPFVPGTPRRTRVGWVAKGVQGGMSEEQAAEAERQLSERFTAFAQPEPRERESLRQRLERETQELLSRLGPRQPAEERFEEYEKIKEGWEKKAQVDEQRSQRRKADQFAAKDFGARARQRFAISELAQREDWAMYETEEPSDRGAALRTGAGGSGGRRPPAPPGAGGGAAGAGGGGGGSGGPGDTRFAPRIASGLTSMTTGSFAAGQVATGVSGVLGGGAVGVAVGTAAGLGIGIAGYEFFPHLQAWRGRRAQFREEFVESEVTAARARALQGRGVPFGTMAGEGMFQVGAVDSEIQRFERESQEYAEIQERMRGLKQEAANRPWYSRLWHPTDAGYMKAVGGPLAERARELRQRLPRFEPAPPPAPRPINELDPERSAAQDRIYPDAKSPTDFETEDMRYGMNLAPLLATLRASGYRSPRGYNERVMQFHRPPTREEREFRGADERENRITNTPRERNFALERDWERFEEEMLTAPPDREMFGDAMASVDPVFRIVGSPYGGMSA